MQNKPLTYYVIEPRDQPCSEVNPKLWKEFQKHYHTPITNTDEIYTEAFCVQWLDLFYNKVPDNV